ncbi:MAG: sugar ABC transporter ATP-binding protein [bacterium]
MAEEVSSALLVAQHLTKEYPGVRALDDISLSVLRDEVHAIVGENGAGKSTLLRILSGVISHNQFSGSLLFDGQPVRFHSSRDAEHIGVSIIHQELALVPDLTVAENIFLGCEPAAAGFINTMVMIQHAQQLLDKFDLHIPAERRVSSLGVGEQQMVEIAKALRKNSRVLILDEPTSALTEREADKLFSILRSLRQTGTAILYISHKLEEVFALADRITVMRDGKHVRSAAINEWNRTQLVRAMVGRTLNEFYPWTPRDAGKVVLDIQNITMKKADGTQRAMLKDVSLQVREGELVGLAGLMGAGRTELLNTIFGNPPGIVSSGRILINGVPLKSESPCSAIAQSVALVPEDRKLQGLIVDSSIENNLSMVFLKLYARLGLLSETSEEKGSNELIRRFGVKTDSVKRMVGTLSGGNQQKVVVGKWLLQKPDVLLLDEPTRGVDVGAKAELYALIDGLKQQGVAILMASSELPELLGVCDRILVMKQGSITGEVERADGTQERIMELAA